MALRPSIRVARALVLAFALAFSVLSVGCEKRAAAPPESWEPNRSCTTHEDCRPAPTCCPMPCNGDVINRSDMGKAEQRVAAHCSEDERARCPQAGSCAGHAYLCIQSKCMLAMEGSPEYQSVKGPTPPPSGAPTTADAAVLAPLTTADAAVPSGTTWDTSCTKDGDCVVVRGGGGGCCPTPCPAGVVNKRDQERAESDLRASCAKQPKHPCPSAGGCRSHEVICEKKRCQIVFSGDANFRKAAE